MPGVTLTSAKVAGPGQTNTSGPVSIVVIFGIKDNVTQPPTGAPTFTLDFYEYDFPDPNDCVGVDKTQASPGVTSVAWVLDHTAQVVGVHTNFWGYTFNVPSFTHGPVPPCGDNFSANDPAFLCVAVPGTSAVPVGPPVGVIWSAAGGTLDVYAPDVPSVGGADIGVTGPSHLANSLILCNVPITAFSRGDDEISTLSTSIGGSGSALYIATDPATQSVPSGFPQQDGRIFVLDSLGQAWSEEPYAETPASGTCTGDVEYFNINTAEPGAPAPTTEMYVVFEGGRQVRYSPNGNLLATTLYLDLAPFSSQPVTGLAVEDRGVPGVFDSSDSVLFSSAGSSAIYKLGFGGVPQFLVANGTTFDGTAQFDFGHFADPPAAGQSVAVGNVVAISVASLSGTQLTPPDRAAIAFVDQCSQFEVFCAGDGLDPAVTSACPCGNVGAPGHGCANSLHPAGGLLGVDGSVLADSVTLHGSGMSNSTCIFLQGTGVVDTVLDDGVMCTGGSLVRLRSRRNVAGASSFPDSTDTVTLSMRGGVVPGSGQVRMYQTYYRNAAPYCTPATANLTSGVIVHW